MSIIIMYNVVYATYMYMYIILYIVTLYLIH